MCVCNVGMSVVFVFPLFEYFLVWHCVPTSPPFCNFSNYCFFSCYTVLLAKFYESSGALRPGASHMYVLCAHMGVNREN